MIRISTIFIAICMVLVSASLGLVIHSLAGFSPMEAGIVALAALTFLILYNAVSMRLRDRTDVNTQISDLSRGTADLARQVAEFGRRLAAMENKISATHSTGQDRIQAVIGEINELGILVKQLATSVEGHDDTLSGLQQSSQIAVPPPIAAISAQNPAPVVVSPQAIPAPQPSQLRAAPEADTTPAREATLIAEMAERTFGAALAKAALDNVPKPAPARSEAQLTATVKSAIADNRIDIYLQPIVTLPQRKVRFYEAVTRLRDEKDQVIVAEEFIEVAEAAGLIGQIDHAVMLRCMQVLRRLMLRNKDVGVFCNIAGATLSNTAAFTQCMDFLEANRALAPSFVLEFKQSALRALGPVESEHLAALAQRGYRFSIDHVTDLRIEPRELADRGVRYIKAPASLLLDQRQGQAADIHPADLSDLLGRFGIDLIAERIEGERAVVDLLDYDVRFGQGFLFAAPRPLRPETPNGGDRPIADKASQDTHGSAKSAISELPKVEAKGDRQSNPKGNPASSPAPTTGNAALARRVVSPN